MITGKTISIFQLKTSAYMAIAMGVFLPIAETTRRIKQILNFHEFFSWFDDYMLGLVLLIAGVRALKKYKRSTSYLITAWGIGAGALLLSFLGEFQYYRTSGDPGIFSTTFVAIAKGLILIYTLVGLYYSIEANERNMSNKV